jgi:hypothetical protein
MTTETIETNGHDTEAQVPANNTEKTMISMPLMRKETLRLELIGTSPLITHAWSEKAKKEMLDKQMKKAKPAKEAKDPFQDYVDSMYWMSPKPKKVTNAAISKATFGFPSVAFKNAAVGACAQISGLTKVFTRGAFHVNLGQELTVIQGSPIMREDMVRIGMGTADIRYRGEFPEWKVELDVLYNASAISPEQIANLFETAGFSIGIGEWRAERDGAFGMFTLLSQVKD